MTHLWEVTRGVLAEALGHEEEKGEGIKVERDVSRFVELYDFVSDRFMAVRKDMILQGLSGPGARGIYQRIIRFHIFFDYLLTQQVPPIFDAHMGLGSLRSGLATLFGFYKEETTRQAQKEEASTTDTHLLLDEFLAYHILLQAHDVLLKNDRGAAIGESSSGWEKVFLQVHWVLGYVGMTIPSRKEEGEGARNGGNQRRLVQTRFALQVAKALAGGNSARCYRLCREGPQEGQGGEGREGSSLPLVRCLLYKLLPATRRRSLEVWSKIMFKKEKMPVGEVGRLLCFERTEDVVGFLILHRLDVRREGGGVGEEDDQGQDAWESAAAPTSSSTSKKECRYYEPRAASLSYPTVAQTIDERRRIRGLLCPRQDTWVLEAGELELGPREGEGEVRAPRASEGLAVLWERMGLV